MTCWNAPSSIQLSATCKAQVRLLELHLAILTLPAACILTRFESTPQWNEILKLEIYPILSFVVCRKYYDTIVDIANRTARAAKLFKRSCKEYNISQRT